MLDWKRLFESRATTTLIVVSATLTILSWQGSDLSRLVSDSVRMWTEPWTLVTGTLLHANLLHLVFNLYWIAVFGMLVETSFGLTGAALLYLFLAVASSGPQVALAGPGIGLSGVGYGLFGFVWALSRFDARQRGILDFRTTAAFVVWFFVCIAASAGGALPIGNIAHGAGAVAGAALGFAVSDHARSTLVRALPLFLVLIALGLACTILRPRLSSDGVRDHEARVKAFDLKVEALEALQREDDARAEDLLTVSLEIAPPTWQDWWNLGLARWHQGRHESALEAFERADAMTELAEEQARFLRELRGRLSRSRGGRESRFRIPRRVRRPAH